MNKKQLAIELAMPIVFILMGIYVIVEAMGMGSEGVFPIMSAGVLLLCAVYLIFEILKKQKTIVKLEGVNLKMVGLTVLTLIIYVVLLKKIGYVIDTFLLSAFIMRALGYKKVPVIALCSALAVAVTFVVFKVLLSVPLPMILLDF